MSDFIEINRDLTMVNSVTKSGKTVWTATCRQDGCEDYLAMAYSHDAAQDAANTHQREKHDRRPSQTIRTDWGVRWTVGPETGRVWGYTNQTQAERGVEQQRLGGWDGEVVSRKIIMQPWKTEAERTEHDDLNRCPATKDGLLCGLTAGHSDPEHLAHDLSRTWSDE